FHASAPGQLFHRLGKAQSLKFTDKADGIAVSAAAKTVIKTFVWSHVERGCFLVVKRAAGFLVAAGFFEGNAGPDQFPQINAIQQVFNKSLRDQSAHGGSTSSGVPDTNVIHHSQKCRRSQASAAFSVCRIRRNAVPAISLAVDAV